MEEREPAAARRPHGLAPARARIRRIRDRRDAWRAGSLRPRGVVIGIVLMSAGQSFAILFYANFWAEADADGKGGEGWAALAALAALVALAGWITLVTSLLVWAGRAWRRSHPGRLAVDWSAARPGTDTRAAHEGRATRSAGPGSLSPASLRRVDRRRRDHAKRAQNSTKNFQSGSHASRLRK